MSLPVITARRLVTDIGSIEYPVLTVADDGTLEDINSDPRALADETSTLTATFVDIHTHGAMGHDVMSATAVELSAVSRFVASRGVGVYLPTTVTAGVDDTLRSLERLADAIEAPAQARQASPLGVHLEGPFLSHAKRGVHPASALQPPSIELFERFYKAARGHVLLMTIAPEPHAWMAASSKAAAAPASSAALDLIRYATGKGVRASIGHTNALASETLSAIAAGATSATHTFNAMRPLDHREPGVLGTVLDADRLFAEMICDGIHVDPALVRLWWKAKGPERALLVTDAMAAAGMGDGEYTLGGLRVHVQNGRALLAEDLAAGKETLAGSVLTMDRAVGYLQRVTGASLEDAVRAASDNPAQMLGQPELTRLAPGSRANLNRFDEQGTLIATYLGGLEVPHS